MTIRIQLALDMLDRGRAIEVAKLCAPYVDIIEAGTPLIKSVGIGIVKILKQTHNTHLVVADLKSSDVGAYEAEMAFSAGADIITTLGVTTTATIIEVQREADKWNRQALVDMTGVKDPVERALELKDYGINMVLYHRSIDEEVTQGAVWNDEACRTVMELTNLGMDVLVAGGINLNTLPLLCKIKLYGIIIGRSITAHEDPAFAAREFKQKSREFWTD